MAKEYHLASIANQMNDLMEKVVKGKKKMARSDLIYYRDFFNTLKVAFSYYGKKKGRQVLEGLKKEKD